MARRILAANVAVVTVMVPLLWVPSLCCLSQPGSEMTLRLHSKL